MSFSTHTLVRRTPVTIAKWYVSSTLPHNYDTSYVYQESNWSIPQIIEELVLAGSYHAGFVFSPAQIVDIAMNWTGETFESCGVRFEKVGA